MKYSLMNMGHYTTGANDEGEAGADFAFSETSIRKAFIRKVYLTLAAQLLLTFGIVSIFVFVSPVKEFTRANQSVYVPVFSLMVALIAFFAFCGDYRMKTPVNYITFVVFTLCEGCTLGCISAFYEGWQVLAALGAIIAVVLALTLFALQPKYDFTLVSCFLIVLATLSCICGISYAVYPSQLENILYSCLGALVFCLYLVCDTQWIVGGCHCFTFSPDDYVFAAINVYLDVFHFCVYNPRKEKEGFMNNLKAVEVNQDLKTDLMLN